MNAAPPPVLETRKSGLAIWSLVFGILAVVLSVACVGPLFAIPAVICGHMAHSRIKRSGGALSGGGLALGGLITGYISIAMIPVIAMLAAIAIPNFVKARDTAMRNACTGNLRQIVSAKQQWALENRKDENATPTADDLDKYLKREFSDVKCPKGGNYSINAVGENPACSAEGHESLLQPSPETPR
jgi:hypothetical protein